MPCLLVTRGRVNGPELGPFPSSPAHRRSPKPASGNCTSGVKNRESFLRIEPAAATLLRLASARRCLPGAHQPNVHGEKDRRRRPPLAGAPVGRYRRFSKSSRFYLSSARSYRRSIRQADQKPRHFAHSWQSPPGNIGGQHNQYVRWYYQNFALTRFLARPF
jgi:hypothetical protein